MTESEIRTAFQSYKHPYYGVVGLYPANGEGSHNYTCDNYHLFNALYWRLLHSQGYAPTINEISNTWTFSNLCNLLPGLYARFPTRMSDDISQDEIYGLCATAHPDVAKYGSENWWCYNLASPGTFKLNYFFGRYPSFIGYVKASADKPIYFSQLIWCLGFLCSALTPYSETSGKLLSWLQIPNMQKYFIPKLAILTWRVIMRVRYRGGIKELMGIYFGNNHPFAKCAREDFQ